MLLKSKQKIILNTNYFYFFKGVMSLPLPFWNSSEQKQTQGTPAVSNSSDTGDRNHSIGIVFVFL